MPGAAGQKGGIQGSPEVRALVRKDDSGKVVRGYNDRTKTGEAMKELEVLRRLLVDAVKEAQRVHQQDGEEWSAGRQRGLADALELLERVAQKSARLPGDAP